jgi:hypothetical protein
MPDQIFENPDRGAIAASAQNQDAIYRLITGAKPDNLREIVRALGGPKAVAPLVGRTTRTVQRWITTKGTERIRAPRADARQALDAAFTQARGTREGRQRIADTRRGTLMRGQGAKMRGKALCGPFTPGAERLYVRQRTWTDYRVDAGTMDATFDAYIEGGEESAFLAFNQQFGDEYGQSGAYFDEWMFYDMGGLGFSPDVGPGE